MNENNYLESQTHVQFHKVKCHVTTELYSLD